MPGELQIDLHTGVVAAGEHRFGPETPMREVAAALRVDEVGRWRSIVTTGNIEERSGTVRLYFGLTIQLSVVQFEGSDHAPESSVEAKNAAEVERLDRQIGNSGWGHARGRIYPREWGWVYVRDGKVELAYPGYRPAVPLPNPSGGVPFRCCGCGKLHDLGYGHRVLEVARNRGGAPCPDCGGVFWVQADSMTEFYRFKQRQDVCDVAMHPAQGVRAYRLVPPPTASDAGKLQVVSLTVKACPQHAASLSERFPGHDIVAEPDEAER
jgi:hypothetical protein